MKKLKLLVSAFMMAGLLFSTTACVDDNESASVERMRDAKAEQLKAQAELDKKMGEAAVINANANKAYQEALAQKVAAEAKVQDAMAKVQEAMALAAQQTNEQDKATNAIKLQEAQLKLDKAKADAVRETQEAEKKFEVTMAELAAKLEKQKEDAKLALAEVKKQILQGKYDLSTTIQSKITLLMGKLDAINLASNQIAQLKLDIVELENNITKTVIDSTAAVKRYIVGQKSLLKSEQDNLSRYNKNLAFWESYDLTKAADLKGLKANLVTAEEAKIELQKTVSEKNDMLNSADLNLSFYLNLIAGYTYVTTYEPIKVSYKDNNGVCVENVEYTPNASFTGCDGNYYYDNVLYNGVQLYWTSSSVKGYKWARIVTERKVVNYSQNENQWLHDLSNDEHNLTLEKGKLDIEKGLLSDLEPIAAQYRVQADGHYKALENAKATHPTYVVTNNMPSPTTKKDSLIWKADSAYFGATVDIDGIAIPVAKQDAGSKARLDKASLDVSTSRLSIANLTQMIEDTELSIQNRRNNKDLLVNNTEASLRTAIDNAILAYFKANEAVSAKNIEIDLLEQDIALIEAMYYEDQNGNQIWISITEDTEQIQDQIDFRVDQLKADIADAEINIEEYNSKLANPALYGDNGYSAMLVDYKKDKADKMSEITMKEGKLAILKIEKDLLQTQVDDAKQVLAGM